MCIDSATRLVVDDSLEGRRPIGQRYDLVRATLDGLEAGEEDIFPDPMARQVYSAWRQDHKAVERQFASM